MRSLIQQGSHKETRILRGGRIVTPDGILEEYEIHIKDGIISEIRPETTEETEHTLNLASCYILPGLIDIHSDYIEHMAAPRPTAMLNIPLALRECERELISHGITTMYHSISLHQSTDFPDNPIRQPEQIDKLVSLISSSRVGLHQIHHRFHARFEVDNFGMVEKIKCYIQNGDIHLISFMDHTPGQGQYRNMEIFRKTLKGYRAGITDSDVESLVKERQTKEKLSLNTLKELADLALAHDVAIASHDDDTLTKLGLMKEMGVTISEFPITMEVAVEARRLGMHTVLGAPNILLGGSHSGNLSAEKAILEGAVDTLCSDYYPASMLHAVFQMHQRHNLPLSDLVNLVSLNPARAVGIGDMTGSITVGKQADLVIVELLPDGYPFVRDVLVEGYHLFSSRYRGIL